MPLAVGMGACGCPTEMGGEVVEAGMPRGYPQMDEGRERWLPWHTTFLKEPKTSAGNVCSQLALEKAG